MRPFTGKVLAHFYPSGPFMLKNWLVSVEIWDTAKQGSMEGRCLSFVLSCSVSILSTLLTKQTTNELPVVESAHGNTAWPPWGNQGPVAEYCFNCVSFLFINVIKCAN